MKRASRSVTITERKVLFAAGATQLQQHPWALARCVPIGGPEHQLKCKAMLEVLVCLPLFLCKSGMTGQQNKRINWPRKSRSTAFASRRTGQVSLLIQPHCTAACAAQAAALHPGRQLRLVLAISQKEHIGPAALVIHNVQLSGLHLAVAHTGVEKPCVRLHARWLRSRI